MKDFFVEYDVEITSAIVSLVVTIITLLVTHLLGNLKLVYAEKAKIIDTHNFDNGIIGTYNAEIINNLITNIVENSYGKPYIKMDEEHFEALKKAMATILGMDPNEIEMDMEFLADLGADSLDVYQIVMGVEEELGIAIPSEPLQKITTVREAVELIKSVK